MRFSAIVVAAASFASVAIASPNSLAARQSCDLVVCIADILLLYIVPSGIIATSPDSSELHFSQPS
ncbi:hypothetical protein BDQ17DRAFT_1435051 [Cyathus striatus]|nr:hypothetical protein BDQ17DRAFT_1435051 [Cyathus striatus]